MNFRQKKIITTAAGIANIAFTIAVSATATFAWFYNSPATAQGISVQCAIPDSRLSWEILKYDDDLKAGVSSTKTEDFYLEQYDEYISQRNIHSNVILRATMTYGDNELFDNNKQLYVDISCLDNPVLTDSKVNKFTSNVCQFKATVVNYVTNDGNTVVVNKAIDELSADTKYTTATSFFANSTSSTSFLTVNNDTPNKDRDNKIAIIPYFDCGHDLVKQMTVYVECSYKDKLVKYYRSTWGMSETGEIKLKGDINDFNFRVGEKYNGSYVQVRNSSEITSGDYMIAYDNYSAAMDGSLGSESMGNMKMDQASNYIPVEPRKGRIRNNETNYNSRFNYNEENGYLKSASGYNIGRTSNTTNGLNVNNRTENKASLTYDTKSHVYGSADPKPELKFNTTKNVTRFNFYTSETASSQQDITLYKYNENASYDVHLVSIAVSGQRQSFPINSAFEFGGVITATYSDGTTSPINSNLCTFTGFDLSADIPTQTVTVTYEEEGYVASTSYQIAITKDPYIKLDYTRLVGVVGSSYTITASYYFLASEPTYTWTVEDENIATIDPTNNTVRVTLNNTGSTTISCSATGVNNPVNCSVTVSSSTNAYTLVTDASTLKAGDKIVIAEKSNSALAGTIPLDKDYLASIQGEFKNNTVTWTGNDVYEFTLGGSAGNWTLADSDGSLLGATAVKKVAFGGGTTTWSITIDKDNNNATIQNVTETYGRFLYNSSSPRFTTYTSATASNMLLPQIYRLETGSSAVREIIGIEVSSSKTQYFTDDDFVEPTVTVKYSDATSEVINTGYTIDSKDLSTPGKKTITVTYSGFNVSYDIYITKSTLTGISVTPNKTNYYVGDNFSSEDVTVIASYSSTKQKEVTPTSVSGFNNKASGTQKIKITYTEGDISFSKTYEITMNPVVLTSIEITKNPTKMTYNVKDNFDISGMVITAHYDNGSTKEVQNEVTYEKTLSSASNSYSITFTYGENGVEKTVTLTGIIVNQATLTPSQESITGTATNEITNLSVTPDHFSGEVIYEWTSEDETIATITNNETTYKPTILLKKKGTTTLTCYATDGAQDASTSIDVTVDDSSISLDKATLKITVGNNVTLTATIKGTGDPTWASSDTAKATITITPNGKTCTVKGVAAGNATITAEFDGKKATCVVTVSKIHTVSLTLSANTVNVGNTITATASDPNYSGETITWEILNGSSNITLSATTGNEITIEGVSKGSATIIAKCSGGAISSEATINVVDTREYATVASFSRSGNTDTTSGGDLGHNLSNKSGYYQDGGTSGTIYYIQILNESELFNNKTKVKVTAKLGGGTTKNNLGANYYVYAVLLGAGGSEIQSTANVICTAISSTTGSLFTIEIDYSGSVYGVKIYHTKLTGYNIRYFSLSLECK